MASEQQIKTHESFQARNLMQIKNQSENWKKRENEASMRLMSLQDRLKKLKDDQKRLISLSIFFGHLLTFSIYLAKTSISWTLHFLFFSNSHFDF